MNVFNHSKVNLDVLKKKAFNYRWAEVEDGIIPLTAADPDFPIAKEIQDDLIQYIQDGMGKAPQKEERGNQYKGNKILFPH